MANINYSANSNDRVNIRRQSEQYNRSYSQWRKAHNRTLGFYPEHSYTYSNEVNPDSNIQVSEAGIFEKRAEYSTYRRTLSFIGSLLLIFIGAAMLFTFIIPSLIEKFNKGYVYDFFASHIYGENGEVLSLIMSVCGTLSSYIAMIGVGILLLKIPVNVIFPTRILSKRMCISGILIAPMLIAITLMYRHAVGFQVFTQLFSNDEPTSYQICRIVIYVLMIPILSELAFRGVLLTLLRQFGDVSAVITTALLSSAATCVVMGGNLLGVSAADMTLLPIVLFPTSFLCSLCYGYFTFASGSVVTPIIMKIIVSGGNIVYLAICAMENMYTSRLLILSLGVAVFICGFITIIGVMHKPSDDIEIIGNKNYLTPGDKLFCMTQPMFAMPFLFLVIASTLPN